MIDRERKPCLAQPPRDALGDMNAAMTPTGATERDGNIGLPLGCVAREQETYERFDPCHRDVSLRQAWGVDADARVLLHVGRLAPEKNVGLALRVYEQLRLYRPSLRMVVVGDGPQRAALQRAHPDVLFAGMQHGDALARYCASADVFLFPSLTDTFGNVVLEAMASGLATVAFDAAAASVHLMHGRNGWLAAPGDEDAFVKAASRAVIDAAPDGPVRWQARQSALKADWPSQLDAFEQGLKTAVMQHHAEQVQHAALA